MLHTSMSHLLRLGLLEPGQRPVFRGLDILCSAAAETARKVQCKAMGVRSTTCAACAKVKGSPPSSHTISHCHAQKSGQGTPCEFLAGFRLGLGRFWPRRQPRIFNDGRVQVWCWPRGSFGSFAGCWRIALAPRHAFTISEQAIVFTNDPLPPEGSKPIMVEYKTTFSVKELHPREELRAWANAKPESGFPK